MKIVFLEDEVLVVQEMNVRNRTQIRNLDNLFIRIKILIIAETTGYRIVKSVIGHYMLNVITQTLLLQTSRHEEYITVNALTPMLFDEFALSLRSAQ